eukprot:Colp12_sorted_trinity150504_noHs@16118
MTNLRPGSGKKGKQRAPMQVTPLKNFFVKSTMAEEDDEEAQEGCSMRLRPSHSDSEDSELELGLEHPGLGIYHTHTEPPPEPHEWEAHSSGFARKMMEKMGYAGGGLGKEASGIAKAIEVEMKKDRSGLG